MINDILIIKKELTPILLFLNRFPFEIFKIEERFIIKEYKIFLDNNYVKRVVLMNVFHPNARDINQSLYKEIYIMYDKPSLEQDLCLSPHIKNTIFNKKMLHTIETSLMTYDFDNYYWREFSILEYKLGFDHGRFCYDESR